MCGIAGISLADAGAVVDRALLERMARSMLHRGPDSDGFHVDGPVGLAFRRLAIIDVAGGDQPIANEDGRVVVVFNGQIYNHVELRRELEAKGHRFRTRSDTETLVHGYEEWGARGLCERLRGMFAFAIRDAARNELVLGRDRIGIKPLHLRRDGSRLLFASELKTILAAGGERTVCPRALLDFASLGYVPAPDSIFRGVEKLPPGCFAVVRGIETRIERYWEAPFQVREEIDAREAEERVLALLDDSVRVRLMSEVPLGCFLSGGIDSSAVVASMVKALGPSIDAVTVGFDEAAFDERGAAARVAQHLGVSPREEIVKADPSVLDGVHDAFDEPHADPSDVPTYLLCQAARRNVTVALSGDGGDELFAGYRRYAFDALENRMRRCIPAPLRRLLFGPLGEVLPKGDRLPRPLRAKTLVQNLALDPVEAYFRSVSRIAPDEVLRLVDPDLLRAAEDYRPLDRFRAIDRRRNLANPLARVRALDLETWLPDDILAKVDRASMAHSLEVRVPILDHHMVEFATSLPPRLLLDGMQGKAVFKRALRRVLPDDVIDRPKHGFDLPVEAWLRGPLSDELDALGAAGSPLAGFFDAKRAGQLVQEHRAGRRNRAAELWTLLAFGRWRRRWLDRGP